MQLHTFIGSPNGRKVEAVIGHLGLNVEIDNLDFLGGELVGALFKSLNPNAMVPLLIDGDFKLSESNAILQYLADSAGDTTLFPRDRQMRADVVRWQFWETTHFNKAIGNLAFETVAKPNLGLGPTDGALVKLSQTELERFAPVLEQHLVGRRYLVGDEITLADYSVVAFEAYRDAVPFDFSRYPGVIEYLNRIRDTDHWRRSAVRDRSLVGR